MLNSRENESGPLEALQDAHLLLESIRDYAVISTRIDGIVAEWNVGAERLFGHRARDVIGKSVNLIFTPEDQAAGVPEHERAGAIAEGSVADERWHLRADGTRRFVSGRMQLIRKGDTPLGFIKVVRDETERREATDALKSAQQAAEEANAAKDRFLAVLSHELRNPLSPVLTSAALLLKDKRLPDDLREEVQTIKRNTLLEARLLDDLLDVTRISRGMVHLDTQAISIETLIMHVLEICRPEIKGKAIEVDVAYVARNCCVMGDPARLQQILWNLLKNAIKFSPEGGRIHLATGNAEKGQVQVSVQDQGIGMEPSEVERIFRPFEQGNLSIAQRFGGLGLGLSISKTLAELHGGTVAAESPGSGKGSTFVLTLPTLDERRCIPDLSKRRGTTAATPGPLRVLVVEDNVDAARGLAKVLAAMGHTVSTANSVGDALDLASAHTFDVVLSDIGLGQESGLDLVRVLRQKFPGVRAIALSGYGMPGDIEKSMAAGFERHLVKPIDLQELEEVLNGAQA